MPLPRPASVQVVMTVPLFRGCHARASDLLRRMMNWLILVSTSFPSIGTCRVPWVLRETPLQIMFRSAPSITGHFPRAGMRNTKNVATPMAKVNEMFCPFGDRLAGRAGAMRIRCIPLRITRVPTVVLRGGPRAFWGRMIRAFWWVEFHISMIPARELETRELDDRLSAIEVDCLLSSKI